MIIDVLFNGHLLPFGSMGCKTYIIVFLERKRERDRKRKDP
jgi:hypothetical protein